MTTETVATHNVTEQTAKAAPFDQELFELASSVSADFSRNGSEPAGTVSVDWKNWLNTQIARLEALEDNWDGYGADALAPAALQRAHNFLELVGKQAALPPKPWVSLTNGGGVWLEWDTSRVDFIIEIAPSGLVGAHAATPSFEFDGLLAEHLDDAKRAWAQLISDS